MSKVPLFKYRNTIALDKIADLDVIDVDAEETENIEPPIEKKRKRVKKSFEDEGPKRKKQKPIEIDESDEPRIKNSTKKTIVIVESDDDLAVLDGYDLNSIPSPFVDEDEGASSRLLTSNLEKLRSVKQKVSNLNHTLKVSGNNTTTPLTIVIGEDKANVRLCVENRGPQKFKLKFTVRRDGPFSELIQILSQATNTPIDTICLKYDGITIESSKTPAEFFMEDDDVLEYTTIVKPQPQPQPQPEPEPEPSPPSPSDSFDIEIDGVDVLSPIKANDTKFIDEDELARQIDKVVEETVEKNKQKEKENKKNSIKLTVRTANGDDFKFRMQRTDAFSKMIKSIASKQDVNQKSVVLKFEGEDLKSENTPEDFDMEDGDLIDAHVYKK